MSRVCIRSYKVYTVGLNRCLSYTVTDIFSVKYWRELEICVRGHSRSLLQLVPVENFGSYSPSVATVAVSLAVSTQYTNVTDKPSQTANQTDRHHTTGLRIAWRSKNLKKNIPSSDPWRIQVKNLVTVLLFDRCRHYVFPDGFLVFSLVALFCSVSTHVIYVEVAEVFLSYEHYVRSSIDDLQRLRVFYDTSYP